MCSIRGRNSIRVKNDISRFGTICVPNAVHGVSKIHVTHRYKHVGSFADWKNSDVPDAKYRNKQTYAALKHVGLIIRNRIPPLSLVSCLLGQLHFLACELTSRLSHCGL